MTHLTVVSDRLTHIRVLRVQKPLKTGFQAKIIFDVLLTPAVGVGHLIPLVVARGRSPVSVCVINTDAKRRSEWSL